MGMEEKRLRVNIGKTRDGAGRVKKVLTSIHVEFAVKELVILVSNLLQYTPNLCMDL